MSNHRPAHPLNPSMAGIPDQAVVAAAAEVVKAWPDLEPDPVYVDQLVKVALSAAAPHMRPRLSGGLVNPPGPRIVGQFTVDERGRLLRLAERFADYVAARPNGALYVGSAALALALLSLGLQIFG